MVFQQITDKVACEGMCQGKQKEFLSQTNDKEMMN